MDYNEFVKKSYNRNARALDIGYPILGLSGEANEILEKYKKLSRKDGHWITTDDIDPETLEYIKLEMGDIYWYLICLGQLLGLTPEVIQQANIDKLTERYKL